MIGRTLPEANWPACAPACDAVGRSHADRSEKTTPILYLPGVSRQELRAVAECPPALMPLAELQYRGAFWSQVNHKDWTVLAIREMEAVHGKRRSWVWAELDQAPLAVALKHLTAMAETCVKPVAGGALDDVVVGDVNGGWCADAAVVTKVNILYYTDPREALLKAIVE